jgi:FkbM family methyltransferase
MNIVKRDVQFIIDDGDEYSCHWFQNKFETWEDSTFDVLDQFLRMDYCFIDVGAWIGPVTLYAAAKCKHVYCLEPDPIAYSRLARNINKNLQYSNISAYNQGIADFEGECSFGGNGELGNSESTLLVNDNAYIKNGGELTHWTGDDKSWRTGEIINAKMTTFEKLIQDQSIELNAVCLLKIDIEGGEKIVIPAIAGTLSEYRLNMYLSLHWVFLAKEEIINILDIIYSIYPYVFNTTFQSISKEEIINNRIEELAFSFKEPLTR